jgi:hypothetical protein
LSGAPFGTAGYAVFQNTSTFPEDQLERSLNPDFRGLSGDDFSAKLLRGTRDIVQSELPKMGGSWVSAFFLVGLLVPFRNRTLGRLRWFVLGGLAEFVMVQALGRTSLTAETPEINSENLLVIFAPLLFMYGTGLFIILLDQIALPFPAARYLMLGAFCLVSSAPLVFAFLAQPPSALSYPPYYPPWIQDKAEWLGERELLMTDMPWATAWYGGRQSVGWSLKYRNNPSDQWKNDFYEINDYVKRIAGLYLSSKVMKTVDTAAAWDWGHFAQSDTEPAGGPDEANAPWRWVGGENSGDWPAFVLEALVKRQVPSGFPLKAAPRGILPELFLTDSERVAAKTIKSP